MSSGLRSCRVCGNSSFQEDDGFSFCEECGTQAEVSVILPQDVQASGGFWISLTGTGRGRCGYLSPIEGQGKNSLQILF